MSDADTALPEAGEPESTRPPPMGLPPGVLVRITIRTDEPDDDDEG